MKDFQSAFKNNIIDTYGEKGRGWLEKIGVTVQNLAEKWNLTGLEPFPNLTFNYVLSAFRNGNIPVVLKLGTEKDLLQKEAEMLRFFSDYGAVTLVDLGEGALLLQRCVPGHSLMNYFPDDEDKSIEIISNVIKRLQSASKKQNVCGITSLEELLKELYQSPNIAEEYITKACNLAEFLLKTTTQNVVMQGDLHHDNVIYDESEQSWKIIDPSGVIGDLIYEFTSFIINPIDRIWKYDNALSIIKNRILKFSKVANIDSLRLKQWTFVKAVLCLIWTEGTQKQDRLALVKLFNHLV